MDVLPTVNGASTVKEATKAPVPKSPFVYPDLCGRHRLQVEVQMMDREIGFLEEELNSLNVLQPASRCCEEVNASVEAKPDPLLLLNQKTPKSICLCSCIRKCTPKCRKLKWRGCCCGFCCCCDHTKCSCCKSCCYFPRFSCSGYSCGCILSCRDRKESCLCLRRSGPCCMCRCLCP